MDEVRVLLSSYAFNTSNDTVESHVMTANDIARHRWTRENELLGIIKPVSFVKWIGNVVQSHGPSFCQPRMDNFTIWEAIMQSKTDSHNVCDNNYTTF